MISGMCQRLSSAQDGWPTLVGWTGKQLRYCWIAKRPAGAPPCASRLRADRGPAAHVPVTQNDIAPLFSNFSKQTRYAEASTRRARSNAPFRRRIGGMRSKRAGNTFFTPLSSDFVFGNDSSVHLKVQRTPHRPCSEGWPTPVPTHCLSTSECSCSAHSTIFVVPFFKDRSF